MVVEPGLCRTCSETPKSGFLTTGLILNCADHRLCSSIRSLDSTIMFQVLKPSDNRVIHSDAENCGYKVDPQIGFLVTRLRHMQLRLRLSRQIFFSDFHTILPIFLFYHLFVIKTVVFRNDPLCLIIAYITVFELKV